MVAATLPDWREATIRPVAPATPEKEVVEKWESENRIFAKPRSVEARERVMSTADIRAFVLDIAYQYVEEQVRGHLAVTRSLAIPKLVRTRSGKEIFEYLELLTHEVKPRYARSLPTIFQALDSVRQEQLREEPVIYDLTFLLPRLYTAEELLNSVFSFVGDYAEHAARPLTLLVRKSGLIQLKKKLGELAQALRCVFDPVTEAGWVVPKTGSILFFALQVEVLPEEEEARQRRMYTSTATPEQLQRFNEMVESTRHPL